MNEFGQIVFNDVPPVINKEQSFIFKMLSAAFSDISFHEDTALLKAIVRRAFRFTSPYIKYALCSLLIKLK